jgi:ABC-type dipeptide/oligopeptide/nickel transport system ATPase subunit
MSALTATTRNTLHAGHKLQPGVALVITGSQGSGKSTLARIIAASHGHFVEIEASQLDQEFALSASLNTEPRVLVIEGLPSTNRAINHVKALLTNPQATLHRRGAPPRLIASPHLIFSTDETNHRFLLEPTRRLSFIHLSTH